MLAQMCREWSVPLRTIVSCRKSPYHSSYERGCQEQTLTHLLSGRAAAVTCIQARFLSRRGLWFSALDRRVERRCQSQLSRLDGFHAVRWRSTRFGSEATQANPLAEVPTIILCEARGLWLFWVIREGIGLTRGLGADCSTGTPNECMDTLSRTRAFREPMGEPPGMKAWPVTWVL